MTSSKTALENIEGRVDDEEEARSFLDISQALMWIGHFIMLSTDYAVMLIQWFILDLMK